ncbi:integrase family protein [Calothrix sp. NIES-2100]|uniref:tyrosine-type recombinase/integrase n=1 Tax=Calothrix sp. NIES-2100 TaxID=1954172 RepID=UPI000B5ED709|nr:integrase family protein [Calothrix sp. NIES-2100]
MPRNRKGTVSVRDRNGNITLIWQYGGKRFYLALGLPYTPLNLGLATVTKSQIEIDIVTGAFDVTLEKYRPDHQNKLNIPAQSLSFVEDFLKKPMLRQTSDVYRGAVLKFREHFGDRKTEITKPDVEDFIQWLRTQTAITTAKEYTARLAAIWTWAIEEEKIQPPNPWTTQWRKIKTPPPQPKPFSKEEVAKILQSAQSKHYGSFIEFLFRTGCRLGEAISLKWDNISEDCSRVTIYSPKTNRTRVFSLSPNTQQLLITQPRISDHVFTAPRGGKILGTTFRERIWKPLLAELQIPYRKPHNMRITLVSHSLESGIDPVRLSRITGHSTQTMFKHYLGNTGIDSVVPEVF